MLISGFSSITIGWFLIATGVTGLLGLIFIILFFTVGQPFGTLNDICIGLTALLSGTLLWLLNSRYLTQASFLNQIILLLAMIGVVLVLIGSYRAIFAISGFYLSGLYMAAGNAMIGIWLFYINFIAFQNDAWKINLAIFGLVSGGLLLLGFAAIPELFRSIDRKTYAVTIVNAIWGASMLGWLLSYPIWCLWLGQTLLE